MNQNVIALVECSIKSGELENFKALVKEMVEATQANEPSTLSYEFFYNEDSRACQIIERYADSVATITHMGIFGQQFGERFLALIEPQGFRICGTLSAELRAAVSRIGATILAPIGGFAR